MSKTTKRRVAQALSARATYDAAKIARLEREIVRLNGIIKKMQLAIAGERS